MKKFCLFLIVCFLSFSCTTEQPSNISDSLSPPVWIQGIWTTEASEGGETSGMQFTADDLILLYHTEVSFKEEFDRHKRSGTAVRVIEEISPTFYEVTIIYITGAYRDISFTKIDEQTLIWKEGFSEIEIKKR